MKVRMIEMDIVWGKPADNIAKAQKMIQTGERADLYVLPEMWATGFETEPEGLINQTTGALPLEWMKTTAKSLKAALSGSLAVKTADGSYRNRHYFVTPDGLTFYDKHHLFTHGGEQKHYTPGKQTVVAQWKGFRLLLLTCYDLRFPVFSRYGRAGEYDAIIYVANWPAKRMLAWQTLTRARAIENQCYVVAVNRIGEDPVTTYDGGSCIIDPLGRTLAACPETDTWELSLDELQRRRSHFQVLADRD